MARGRKNHGVRQARFVKYWLRQNRRRARYHSGRKKWWQNRWQRGHHLYLRAPVQVHHPYAKSKPFWRYVKKPKHFAQYQSPPRGVSTFIRSPGGNPRTKQTTLGHVHYWQSRHFPVGFIRRSKKFYGKRLHKCDRAGRILYKASAWYHSTVRYHTHFPTLIDVGWPVWDPKGRLPRQAIYGVNL